MQDDQRASNGTLDGPTFALAYYFTHQNAMIPGGNHNRPAISGRDHSRTISYR